MSPMCRCLNRKVEGQVCFLFWPYAVHHMGTSIFHLGHPYYMICSCLTATLAHFQCCCFLFFSTKSPWFGLLCPRCIHLDSFPQEAWGPRVEYLRQTFRISCSDAVTHPSWRAVSARPRGPCWSCSLQFCLGGFTVQLSMRHPDEPIWISWWQNLFMKPGLLRLSCPLIFRTLLTS